jgi:hypothetical protein
MKTKASRRNFLKTSAVAAATVPLIRSLEEYALANPSTNAPVGAPAVPMPCGKIGKVSISRMICGGNLISGFAHSRDLIYVSPLLRHYFTDEKVMETWSQCERHGVNTMILNPADARAQAVYEKYRARGGKLQYLAQIGPTKTDLKTDVQRAKDAGAVGAFLLGNLGDSWTREGDTRLIGELLKNIRDAGMIAGVAGHELRTIMAVEKAGFAPDFYMKTLHDTNYWSQRRPDQMKEVIDNYSIDNYWCMDPKETIAYMAELRRPWIAYKVLAAGAIHPHAGFKHAFGNGADFVAVGMFDFQIAENAMIVSKAVKEADNRDREWVA